ncbi:MAG: class A beta-lactamase [Gammaproteobacteria bacterium]|nr:class A beta-lactamase [Gammaproteobacteria bacterium]
MNIGLKILSLVLLGQSVFAGVSPKPIEPTSIHKKLARLEHELHGKIGIYAIDTNSGKIISYRSDELFPFQSTFKFMGVSALLSRDTSQQLLESKLTVTKNDLVLWSPISGQYLHHEVALRTLAEGAISYSDNTAINMIIDALGGLDKINQFARRIGNQTFDLKHYELNLNSNPKNKSDASTPKDMALSVKNILLGDVLSKSNKQLLMQWMRHNTTGYKRMRSGVPIGWSVADKTGSGRYGVANDIGIVWFPSCKPIILSIYTYQNKKSAVARDDVIANSTEMLLDEFSKYGSCFKTIA